MGIHITDWFLYITNHIKLVTYTPCLTENIQKPYQYFLLVVTTLKIPNRTIPLTRKDRLALLKFGSLCPPKSLRRTQCFCPKPLQSRFGASSTSGNHPPVCLQNSVNSQYVGYIKIVPVCYTLVHSKLVYNLGLSPGYHLFIKIHAPHPRNGFRGP